MSKPKFIQIATGQWKDANGNYNHTVYGLTEEGAVYKFLANEGWTLMRGRNEAPNTPPARRAQQVLDDDIPF